MLPQIIWAQTMSFLQNLELAGGNRPCIRLQGDLMTFRPLQDRVVVRRIDPEQKTVGGIFIPDTAQEKPMEGMVVSVGPGARSEDGRIHPLDVEVGDCVFFGKWSGTEITLDGEELIIIKESDVMGVVEKTVSSSERLRNRS
jgi:chaperonin GroES